MYKEALLERKQQKSQSWSNGLMWVHIINYLLVN